MTGRYRKRPVVISAVRWSGANWNEVEKFVGRAAVGLTGPETLTVWNEAEAQVIRVPVGHWIIKGVRGEFYPCHPDIFEQTYEPVDEVLV